MLREDYSIWRCGRHEISLARPRVMGILNVTPDSFSDGGENIDPAKAVERALQMMDEGADIIDVGGESTRPGHKPVSPEEEAHRIVPVIRGIMAKAPTAIISVDTRHAAVAKVCLRLGVSILNDVTGFTDPAMVQVAAESDCGCIVMHWNKLAGTSSRRMVQLDTERPLRNSAARAHEHEALHPAGDRAHHARDHGLWATRRDCSCAPASTTTASASTRPRL